MVAAKHYTPEIGDKIADLIGDDKTLEEITKAVGISTPLLYKWLQNEEDMLQKYTKAKVVQAKCIENQIQEVMAELRAGILAPDAARVIINSLQWRAARKDPRAYGDKTILSNDPDNPVGGLALRLDTAITQRNQIVDVTPETPALPPPADGSDLV